MNKIKTIFSIVPGRHRLGYAVFHHNKLIFYGVASLSKLKTKDEICKVLERFLVKIAGRFQIDRIAIRKLNKSQEGSPLLVEITENLEILYRKQRIKVLRYDGNFINRQFCQNDERPTKDKTALFLVSKYPELNRYHKLNQDWQQRYYAYLFNAIALGLVCLTELGRKQNGNKN